MIGMGRVLGQIIRNGDSKVKSIYLWHLFPTKAAIMLQQQQAVGFPYCFTLASHRLHTVDVEPLLQVTVIKIKRKQSLAAYVLLCTEIAEIRSSSLSLLLLLLFVVLDRQT